VPERVVSCHACANQHRFEDVVPRRADCERCGAALHACLNCSFHDLSAYNECREPSAERVVDKAAANFCDYFQVAADESARPTAKHAATDELERLFKK